MAYAIALTLEKACRIYFYMKGLSVSAGNGISTHMKNPHAQALGRLGGLAKAKKMTPLDRERQAERAALARLMKAKRKQLRETFDA